MLKQNKGAHVEFETGKDVLTQGGKPGTGGVASIFWSGSVPSLRPILVWLSRA